MKIPKYDEITYAQIVLTNGFLTQYHKYELRIIAKYWKHIGVKPKQRKEMLYDFCNRYVYGFTRESHYKLINSIIAYSNKKTSIPIVVKNVSLYKHEFDFLNNLPIQEYQKKVMLSLLIERKIKKSINDLINNNQNTTHELSPYINIDKKLGRRIFNISKIPSKYKLTKVLYELNQLGYIQVIERELIKLPFIEQFNQQQSEVLESISSFDSVGYYLDLLNGDKKIGFCETCNEIIKRKVNNQKLCKECNETHRREYIAGKVREHRQNVNIQKT